MPRVRCQRDDFHHSSIIFPYPPLLLQQVRVPLDRSAPASSFPPSYSPRHCSSRHSRPSSCFPFGSFPRNEAPLFLLTALQHNSAQRNLLFQEYSRLVHLTTAPQTSAAQHSPRSRHSRSLLALPPLPASQDHSRSAICQHSKAPESHSLPPPHNRSPLLPPFVFLIDCSRVLLHLLFIYLLLFSDKGMDAATVLRVVFIRQDCILIQCVRSRFYSHSACFPSLNK